MVRTPRSGRKRALGKEVYEAKAVLNGLTPAAAGVKETVGVARLRKEFGGNATIRQVF